MKKINGNRIRVYQGGELIGHEFNTYFSESLQFVAVEAYYNDVISSKMIEVKLDNEVLYSETFKECKIIHAAKHNELATSVFIFHNCENQCVSNFRDIFEYMRYEKQKQSDQTLRCQIRKNTKALYEMSLIKKIPMWIRRIFKAV